ncbi:DMT family transporter [Microtetraspora niveoalba]|uniref:DMT family transporter n=1 Tax=Microtetraspora niveoalba TaxID=46175 RepID=UPI001FE0DCBB|nr:DMT family transporter [Microtetraspora niveoalba]
MTKETSTGTDLGGAAARATAGMFVVGTLTAVSDLISTYPVYGGQALRYAVAAAVLLAAARARGLTLLRLSSREFVLLSALSLTGLVVFNVCLIEAAVAAGPTLAGTVLGAAPVVLALLGPLFTGGPRSAPSPRIVASAVVVMAGATLATGLGSGNLPGLLWSLGALACEALFSLLALPLLPRLGAVRVSAYSSALAVPYLLIIGLVMDGTGMLRTPTAAEALGIGYQAVIVTAVAFFLWYSALPRLGPDRAGLFAGMIPIGALVTSVVLGLGVPSPADVGGAAVVVAGILLGLAPRTGGRPPRARPDADGHILRSEEQARNQRIEDDARVRLHRPAAAWHGRDGIPSDHHRGGTDHRGGGAQVP